MITSYIALGANLGDARTTIEQAIAALAQLPETQLLARSSLYRSCPMGPQDQPDYINAVVAIAYPHSALQLLDALQQLEQQFGRVRLTRWGARTLDLDLLLFGDQLINHPRLQVPHVGLCERDFVLIPLAQIAPDLILPTGIALKQLISNCPSYALEKLD